MLLNAAAGAADSPVKIGVGSQGPISPQAMYQIEQEVAALPNVQEVPIQPPGGVDAAVRRFVAGEADDRLDGMIVVTLPPDSFKIERNSREASFSGSYEIDTLDLSTLAEDHHQFTFQDSEPVTGGMAALLALPVELLTERTTGTTLISGNTWQAFETVRTRIEAKLVAATGLYLETAPIRNLHPLDRLQCAQHLLDLGEVDTAMAVFRSVGVNNPQVSAMIAAAKEKMKQARAQKLFGRALGAIADGDARDARTILASYEKEPAARPERVASLKRALEAIPPAADGTEQEALKGEVAGLDRAAFVAMVKEVFSDEARVEPADVELAPGSIAISDKAAAQGIKTELDAYALALGRSARLLSLRCRCDATATLKIERAGAVLLQARFGPSFSRAQVGLP